MNSRRNYANAIKLKIKLFFNLKKRPHIWNCKNIFLNNSQVKEEIKMENFKFIIWNKEDTTH